MHPGSISDFDLLSQGFWRRAPGRWPRWASMRRRRRRTRQAGFVSGVVCPGKMRESPWVGEAALKVQDGKCCSLLRVMEVDDRLL